MEVTSLGFSAPVLLLYGTFSNDGLLRTMKPLIPEILMLQEYQGFIMRLCSATSSPSRSAALKITR